MKRFAIARDKKKPHNCHICNKSFSQRITLDRHSILHTNRKPFSCNKCKKSFYLKFDLTEHYKSHTEKKTYSCEECNEIFPKISQLNKHRIVHTDHSLSENLVQNQASKLPFAKKISKSKVPKKKKVKINTSVPSKRAKKDAPEVLQEKFKEYDLIFETVQSSGVIESSFNTLYNLCKNAAQFKKHARRDNLIALDIDRASSSKILDTCPSNVLIDLKTLVKEPNECIENEKVFYHGKCLHNLTFNILKDQIPDENLRNYFKFVLESLFKDDSDLFSYSLTDLKRNPYILPLLPFFIQSICNNVILLKYPPTQLQKFLKILQSLHQNPNLYFGSENLYQLINFITSCITSNLRSTSFNLEDYCYFQKNACEILQNILSKDCIQLKNLYTYTLSRLEIPIKNSKLRFLSCYGAITAVNVIGLPAILHILPLLFHNSSKKLHEICGIWCIKEVNMFQVKVVDACEKLFKYYLKDINEDKTLIDQLSISKSGAILNSEVVPLNIELCSNILDFYGDLLNSRFSYLKFSSDKIVSIKDFFHNVLFKTA